jgi:hypothetical protein
MEQKKKQLHIVHVIIKQRPTFGDVPDPPPKTKDFNAQKAKRRTFVGSLTRFNWRPLHNSQKITDLFQCKHYKCVKRSSLMVDVIARTAQFLYLKVSKKIRFSFSSSFLKWFFG